MNKLFCLFALFGLIAITQSVWVPHHTYSVEVSKQIANGIKATILNKQSLLPGTISQQLVNDLNTDKDGDRKLKQLKTAEVKSLFEVFGLKAPADLCDNQNVNGVVEGNELKCLNRIWKSYVPADA